MRGKMAKHTKKQPKEKEEESKIIDQDNSLGNISAFQKTLSDKYIVALIAITLLGTILRLHSLASEAVWLDEATSIRMANRNLLDIIFANSDFAHPPLYYSILHFVMMVSQSEFALRLPSAIFGSLSIPLIYLVGRSLIDQKTAITASFLLAISSFHIHYSQEGRSYALMLMLVLLTVYLFIQAYNKNDTKIWGIAAISAALLVYTHFFGFFVIAAIGLYYLISEFDLQTHKLKSFEKSKKAILSAVAFLVLSFPIIIWLVKELGYVSGNKTWGMSQDGFFHTIFLSYSSYSNTLLYLYVILLGIGLIFCLKDHRRSFSLLSIWLFLPLITGYYLAGSMPFQPRYLLFLLPAYLLLISAGIVGISNLAAFAQSEPTSAKKGKTKKQSTSVNPNTTRIAIIAIVLLIVCGISYAPLNNYYTGMSKNDWRTAATALEEITMAGDTITPLPGYMFQPLEYYYDNQTDGTFIESTGYSDAQMTAHAQSSNRVWYIVTWDISAANPDGSAVQWLQTHATPVGQITGIHIFTYPKVNVVEN